MRAHISMGDKNPTEGVPELPDGEKQGNFGQEPELPDGEQPDGEMPQMPNGEDMLNVAPSDMPEGQKMHHLKT